MEGTSPVGCDWVALGIKTEPTLRPADGHLSARLLNDLRHFYASLLIAHGCSVKAVQRRLGHQSAMETLDTYSHLWPDSDDETREAVDAVLARPRPAMAVGG